MTMQDIVSGIKTAKLHLHTTDMLELTQEHITVIVKNETKEWAQVLLLRHKISNLDGKLSRNQYIHCYQKVASSMSMAELQELVDMYEANQIVIYDLQVQLDHLLAESLKPKVYKLQDYLYA